MGKGIGLGQNGEQARAWRGELWQTGIGFRRLVDLYRPERVYLFGSAARGTAGPDSDYDLMVVVPDETPEDVVQTKEVHRILWDIDASVDVLVWRRTDFDGRLHLRASLPATVVREGKLLHAA